METDLLAMIWLFSLLAVGLSYFLRQVWLSDYDLWESCLYLPTYLFGRLLWRVHFQNQAPAAIKAGAVIAANHRSSVDPFFVQLAARRRVHWMVAKEYTQHFAFGPLLRALQVIPTNRSGLDTAATKSAMRLTQAGSLVGMFPEGRLNQTSRPLLPVRSGAALVAMRSQVPLIPLLIEGSPLGKSVWSPVFIPASVQITFGKPIWPPLTEQAAADVPNSNIDDAVGAEQALATGTPPDSTRGEHILPRELTESDALIVQWGQQILELAGHAGSPIEFASKRRRRHKNHE